MFILSKSDSGMMKKNGKFLGEYNRLKRALIRPTGNYLYLNKNEVANVR